MDNIKDINKHREEKEGKLTVEKMYEDLGQAIARGEVKNLVVIAEVENGDFLMHGWSSGMSDRDMIAMLEEAKFQHMASIYGM